MSSYSGHNSTRSQRQQQKAALQEFLNPIKDYSFGVLSPVFQCRDHYIPQELLHRLNINEIAEINFDTGAIRDNTLGPIIRPMDKKQVQRHLDRAKPADAAGYNLELGPRQFGHNKRKENFLEGHYLASTVAQFVRYAWHNEVSLLRSTNWTNGPYVISIVCPPASS